MGHQKQFLPGSAGLKGGKKDSGHRLSLPPSTRFSPSKVPLHHTCAANAVSFRAHVGHALGMRITLDTIDGEIEQDFIIVGQSLEAIQWLTENCTNFNDRIEWDKAAKVAVARSSDLRIMRAIDPHNPEPVAPQPASDDDW